MNNCKYCGKKMKSVYQDFENDGQDLSSYELVCTNANCTGKEFDAVKHVEDNFEKPKAEKTRRVYYSDGSYQVEEIK